jgi:transcriptional regulator with XRE-family HTH domain
MTQLSGSELGRRVKHFRLQKGMTLKEIEAKVGVSATHVSEVERGKTSPTVGALCKIAAALGVNASYLIDFPLQPDQPQRFLREARPGDKFLYIIEGLVEIKVGDQTYLLKRGDSLHFKASQVQELQNMGEGPCRILWADWPRYTL